MTIKEKPALIFNIIAINNRQELGLIIKLQWAEKKVNGEIRSKC